MLSPDYFEVVPVAVGKVVFIAAGFTDSIGTLRYDILVAKLE